MLSFLGQAGLRWGVVVCSVGLLICYGCAEHKPAPYESVVFSVTYKPISVKSEKGKMEFILLFEDYVKKNGYHEVNQIPKWAVIAFYNRTRTQTFVNDSDPHAKSVFFLNETSDQNVDVHFRYFADGNRNEIKNNLGKLRSLGIGCYKDIPDLIVLEDEYNDKWEAYFKNLERGRGGP